MSGKVQSRVVIEKAQKTVDVPQIWYVVVIVDVMFQRQVPTVQTVQKTEDVPQIRCLDRVVNVPVATQHQMPMIQKTQRTVEINQVRFIHRIVEVQAHSVPSVTRFPRSCGTFNFQLSCHAACGHRPPAASGGKQRLGIPIFFMPPLDMTPSCLGCVRGTHSMFSR